MKSRIVSALLAGAAVAGIVVYIADKGRHAALAAEAAKTHQTAGSIEASGFAGITLFVALVVFVAGTVLAGRRKARTAAASRAWQGAPQPRRRGRAGAWR